MSNVILHKYSATVGSVPTTASLKQREIAINTADGILFIQTASGTIKKVNPNVPLFKGTTSYAQGTYATYVNTATTDANGRITLYLTSTGLSGGTALFSSILTVTATGVATATSNVTTYPYFVIETVSTTSVILRGVVPNTLLALGNTAAFVGSGVTCHIQVTGLL